MGLPQPRLAPPRTPILWRDAYSVIEPRINAEGIHYWQFDPTFPIDVPYLIFDHRHPIRLNRHDYFELLYGCSGEGAFQVQDRILTVGEGDLFVIGSALYHRPVQSGPPPAKAIALYFLPELIRAQEETGDDVQYLMPYLSQDSTFPHVVPASSGVPAKVVELIQQVHSELPATSQQSRLAVKTYLKMMLVLLGKHYAAYGATEDVFDRKHRDIERLRPLFEYIDRHYAERITVADAAALVYMSKSHFIRFFKQVTADSFAAHLNHFRVAKAQAMLAATDKSIAEVSRETGFCDQSHFGMVFRRFVRMTPLQYRRIRGGALADSTHSGVAQHAAEGAPEQPGA